MNKHIVLAAFASFVLMSSPRAAELPLLHDDFNDNALDPAKWTSWTSDAPITVVEQNGQVEISIPGSIVPATGDFGASYGSVCQLTGDYDVQVRFQLLTWPAANGVRVGLGNGPQAVERVSLSATYYDQGPAELYLTDGPSVGTLQGMIPAEDRAGYLRAVRIGDVATGYYRDPQGNWTVVGSDWVGSADASLGIAAWTDAGRFIYQDVRIAFDDFAVTRGAMVCGGSLVVPIDIRSQHDINNNANDTIEVAILSTPAFDAPGSPGFHVAAFDATQLEPASVHLADAGIASLNDGSLDCRTEDVDHDGLLDFVGRFVERDLGLPAGATFATVTGRTTLGRTITGTDTVVVH